MEHIFAHWQSLADMARDIGQSPITVRHWRRRRMIPAKHDGAIVDAARRNGWILTYADLSAARQREFSRRDAARASTAHAA